MSAQFKSGGGLGIHTPGYAGSQAGPPSVGSVVMVGVGELVAVGLGGITIVVAVGELVAVGVAVETGVSVGSE